MRGLLLAAPVLLFFGWLVFSSWRGRLRNRREQCFNCGVGIAEAYVLVTPHWQGRDAVRLCPGCARQRRLWAWGSAVVLLLVAGFVFYRGFFAG